LNPIYTAFGLMFPIMPWIEAKLTGKDLSSFDLD
jgi:hypothetical protein